MVRREPRRGRRRESRLLQSMPLLRVVEIVCAYYEIERAELSRRGSRHPARATLAYLARSWTMSTNADLAVTLGLSRAECVPNLTRRFSASLAADAKFRRQLKCLEEKLDEYGSSELTSYWVTPWTIREMERSAADDQSNWLLTGPDEMTANRRPTYADYERTRPQADLWNGIVMRDWFIFVTPRQPPKPHVSLGAMCESRQTSRKASGRSFVR